MAQATEKQVTYILALANKKRMSIKWLDSSWKPFTTMKQRNGKVEDFLHSLNKIEASNLIDRLR